ncbi:MAG: LPXTG cell wall anchor domain-containing protein [Acidimicrobiia bacterium]
MANTPIPKPNGGRGKPISALLLTLAMLAAFVGFAPFASAHHAEVSATAACPVNGNYTVTYTAKSWDLSSGSAQLKYSSDSGKSGKVQVQYRIGNGSWQNLPDGEFTSDNGRQFTGTFSVPAGVNATVQVRDQGYWSNGVKADGNWRKATVTPKTGCTETVTPTTPTVSRTGECEAKDQVTVPESTNQITYTSSTKNGVVTVVAKANNGFVFPSTVPTEMASQGWAKGEGGKWVFTYQLGRNEPCPKTRMVIPEKYWDFGDIPEGAIPADGSATVTITVSEGETTYTKSWTFDTSGNFVGDSTPLEMPESVEIDFDDVGETFINPDGWSCSRSELMPVSGNYHGGNNRPTEVVPVRNVCTRRPPVTIPPPVTVPPTTSSTTTSSTTSTTEEVGGIDETPSTSTTEEVLDTVVTPTTVAQRRLPRTGTNSTTALSLAGALVTAGAAFVLFSRRRFHTDH